MLKRLKVRFIVLSMASLFVLLALVVAGMNLLNYRSVVAEADAVLELLSHNRGRFPESENIPEGMNRPDGPIPGAPTPDGSIPDDPAPDGPIVRMPRGLSPELPYESRYFSVLLTEALEVKLVDISRIVSVDREQAVQYALQVADTERGFAEHYRYVCTREPDGLRVTFLDCGRKLEAVREFLFISAGMALIGFVIVFFVIVIVSGRIVRPIAESHEKQRRFITDAGHEIKTPLAIIGANADVLEMDLGDNESVSDIRQQVKRLTQLTNDLICLARLDEAEGRVQMNDFPVSELLQQTAASFRAAAQGKTFETRIPPGLWMRGNQKSIEQLVCIVLDNAVKYCPDGGEISFQAEQQGKHLCLTVQNTTRTPVDPESLPHVFERFYRADPSRSSETGGHGIGLSVAQAIVAAHGGKIRAQSPSPETFRILLTLAM